MRACVCQEFHSLPLFGTSYNSLLCAELNDSQITKLVFSHMKCVVMPQPINKNFLRPVLSVVPSSASESRTDDLPNPSAGR